MSHLHFTLLRKRRGGSWTKLPWPCPLVPYRGVVEEESPPLHPTEKKKRMVMDQAAMANYPVPYRGVVEDESPPVLSTEKDKRMVSDHVAMAKSPCSFSGSCGG